MNFYVDIIVQGSRYCIFEDLGCETTGSSYVNYVVVEMWPIIFGVMSVGYCRGWPSDCLLLSELVLTCPTDTVLTLNALRKHWKELEEFFTHGSDVSIHRSQYRRLMVVAGADTCFWISSTCIDVAMLAEAASAKKLSLNAPYLNWENIHADFGFIYTFEKEFWSTSPWLSFQITWKEWQPVFAALLFFAVFGNLTVRKISEKATRILGRILHRGLPEQAGRMVTMSAIQFGPPPPVVARTDETNWRSVTI